MRVKFQARISGDTINIKMQNQSIRKSLLTLVTISMTWPALFAQEARIELENKDSVLYIGWDNMISVTINCRASDSLFMETNNGTITQVWKNKFIYRSFQKDTATLTLMLNQKNAANKVAQRTFVVKELPDPVACVGKRTSGSFEKDAFVAQGGVGTLQLEALKIKVMSQVIAYTFTIKRNNRIIFTTKNNGPAFSEKIKNSFATLVKGDTVVIDSIRIKKADARIISAKQLKFLIN